MKMEIWSAEEVFLFSQEAQWGIELPTSDIQTAELSSQLPIPIKSYSKSYSNRLQ